jgi:hypothetical protein
MRVYTKSGRGSPRGPEHLRDILNPAHRDAGQVHFDPEMCERKLALSTPCEPLEPGPVDQRGPLLATQNQGCS